MQSFRLQLTDTDKRIIIGAAAIGALTLPGVAMAQQSVDDVTATVTAIGTVTGGVAAIVLTAMGFRIAVTADLISRWYNKILCL